jgi:4-hydroxybenzoyl-CoA thioesterase
MGKIGTMTVDVDHGDCDPMGLLLAPRVQCWIDAAAAEFFARCGLAPWRELQRTCGIVGLTLIEQHARFVRPAACGDRLGITTEVMQWLPDAVVQRHVATRGDELIFECVETLAFVAHDPAGPPHVRVVPVPEDIRLLCS